MATRTPTDPDQHDSTDDDGPRELPDVIPGIDEDSRERWEDESPASTLARPGSGVDPTPST